MGAHKFSGLCLHSVYVNVIVSDVVLCSLQPAFLDIYVNAILSAKEKPGKSLTEAFHPLYLQMSHEDFQSIVIPSSVKMLKRNPEIVLESVGILLKSVNLDLSKYAAEILSVVLAQARHADEGRRDGALAIVHSLSQKSSNPDALDTMFNAIKAVIKGIKCHYACVVGLL